MADPDRLDQVMRAIDTIAATIDRRIKAGGPQVGADVMECPVCKKTLRYHWQPGRRGRDVRARCDTPGCVIVMT